ncbi:MAG: HAMP domain-containing protein [Clostridiales bacterium]|nr:HAMP domain-containing protein [Clostridiales bacterium]
MKNLTVRTKITLWFSALIILITAIMFTVILLISRNAIYTDVKQTLTDIVTANTGEIEYHASLDYSEMESGDQFINYNDGYLEINDDYLNESLGAYSALYDSSGNLLYGENFINAQVIADSTIRTVNYNKEKYYVVNIPLKGDGLDGLTLQGIINEDANKTVLTTIATLSLLILPSLALIAIIGCYLLAGRFLRPIRDITASAEEISDGNDLSKCIQLGKSRDELYTLGDTFNKMFERLEQSFEEEKQFISDISHELRTPCRYHYRSKRAYA